MFDDRDAEFTRARAESRLGAPVLTEQVVVFLSGDPFPFDSFDESNAEFVRTTVMPRLPPPVMLRDGSVRCVLVDVRAVNYGV
jgi:hypothetical protein